MMRAHYLRGFTPDTIPTIYPDERIRSGRFVDETNWWSTRLEGFEGCATCRDGRIACPTPAACGLATEEQIEEAEAVSSLHRLAWPLCMTVIGLAALASVVWPWGFAK